EPRNADSLGLELAKELGERLADDGGLLPLWGGTVNNRTVIHSNRQVVVIGTHGEQHREVTVPELRHLTNERHVAVSRIESHDLVLVPVKAAGRTTLVIARGQEPDGLIRTSADVDA